MDGKYVTARKDHDCSMCPWRIPAGTDYWRETLTPWDHPDNEGYFTVKAHPLCYDFHRANYEHNEGVIYQYQWDDEIVPAVHDLVPAGCTYPYFDGERTQVDNTVVCECGLTVDLGARLPAIDDSMGWELDTHA